MNINLFKLTEQFKQKREINFILISEILKFSSIFHTLTTFSSGTLRCAPRVLFEHTHTRHEEIHSECILTHGGQGLGDIKQNKATCHEDNEPRSNFNFIPPRNVTLKQLLWNFLINTSEVIYLYPPFPPQKVTLLETIFFLTSNFFHPTQALRTEAFHFVQLLWASVYLVDGMQPDTWITQELIWSLHLLSSISVPE